MRGALRPVFPVVIPFKPTPSNAPGQVSLSNCGGYDMRIRTTLGEVLPVLGTIGLLGLWTFQQTGIEIRTSELQKLAAAHAVYQTYQSHNAIFNAVIATAGNTKGVADEIRRFQINNYETGLQAIEDSLPSSEKKDIPAAPPAYDSSMDTDTKINLTQERLEKLQTKLADRQAAISREAASAKRLYLWLYVGLSLMMVTGAILKAMEKLAPSSS